MMVPEMRTLKCQDSGWNSIMLGHTHLILIKICLPCLSRIIMEKTFSKDENSVGYSWQTIRRLLEKRHSNVLTPWTLTLWANSVILNLSKKLWAKGNFWRNSTSKVASSSTYRWRSFLEPREAQQIRPWWQVCKMVKAIQFPLQRTSQFR